MNFKCYLPKLVCFLYLLHIDFVYVFIIHFADDGLGNCFDRQNSSNVAVIISVLFSALMDDPRLGKGFHLWNANQRNLCI